MTDWNLPLLINFIAVILLGASILIYLGVIPIRRKKMGVHEAPKKPTTYIFSTKYGFQAIEKTDTSLPNKDLIWFSNYDKPVEEIRLTPNKYGPANCTELEGLTNIAGGERFFFHWDDETARITPKSEIEEIKFKYHSLLSETLSLRRENKMLRERRLEELMEHTGAFKMMKAGLGETAIIKKPGTSITTSRGD